MTQTLPTPRDLPPNRHAEIRAGLLREVARRPRRRWIVPVVAACAVVVVVLAVVLLPIGQPESAPPAWVRKGPPDLPPGITLEERTELEESCAAHADQPPEFRLYNAVSDEFGTLATFYRDDYANLTCMVDPEGRYWAHFVEIQPDAWRWGPGALGFEALGDGVVGRAPDPVAVIGTLRSDIRRVTMANENSVVEATVVNQTFIARVAGVNGQPLLPVVRGYDADGALVDTLHPNDGYHVDCYVHPDGRYMTELGHLLDPREYPTDGCKPANPWP